ncbi:(R,S)-reticuline 7-O-methyltransferase-like [Nymphaea colorata]|nr:(R,S)-reticuline 7-O-methyltransferase-like [Nymphaea colorata]
MHAGFGVTKSQRKRREEKGREMEEEWLVQGQALIWEHILAFATSMALKCVVELGIADIIEQNRGPMTLHQMVAQLPTPSPDLHCLRRIMRVLVHKRVFAQHQPTGNSGEPTFGLTPASRWLVKGGELTLAPMVLMYTHLSFMASWHCFSRCVMEGGVAFEKAHAGVDLWGYCSRDPGFGKLFNSAMACNTKLVTKAIIKEYKDGFRQVSSLVDVGGGVGTAIGGIVKAYPHITGINLDLPHVVETAPDYEGVTHVGGDMFAEIPKADAVFMKWILHDWDDENCLKILKQCRKAIPEETGKLVIVDAVLQPNEEGAWADTRMIFDLAMMAHTSGGRERTEMEWKNLLEEGGFNRYNIISLPSLPSLIEAFPN